jgi:hypothetical protein
VQTLTGLLTLARALGFGKEQLAELRRIAEEQGIAFAQMKLREWVEERMRSADLSSIRTKAALDGKRRKDKDGIEFSDREYFLHEADYLLWKAVLRKGGPVIDRAFRDTHFPKVYPRVLAHPAALTMTQDELYEVLVTEELDFTLSENRPGLPI